MTKNDDVITITRGGLENALMRLGIMEQADLNAYFKEIRDEAINQKAENERLRADNLEKDAARMMDHARNGRTGGVWAVASFDEDARWEWECHYVVSDNEKDIALTYELEYCSGTVLAYLVTEQDAVKFYDDATKDEGMQFEWPEEFRVRGWNNNPAWRQSPRGKLPTALTK